MSESDSKREKEAESPGVNALARFLMTYDLPELEELPQGFQPIVSSSLRRLLSKTLAALSENGVRRKTVVHGFQRITLQREEIGGKEWVLAGLAPIDLEERIREVEASGSDESAEGQKSPSAWPRPTRGPGEDQDSDSDSFSHHFRGLRGEFYSMRPRDLIQFFCTCGASIEVRFVSNFGQSGEVLIDQGQVTHVEAEGQMGESAAELVLHWESGDFSTRPLRESPPRTIFTPWIHFLLEYAKLIDESGEFPSIPNEVQPETLESLPNWMDF